MIYRLAKIHPL